MLSQESGQMEESSTARLCSVIGYSNPRRKFIVYNHEKIIYFFTFSCGKMAAPNVIFLY